MLEQNAYFIQNDIQSVNDGDGRRVEMGLQRFDIRRSRNQNQ